MLEVMSKSEAARILGVSEITIEKYVKKDLLREVAGQSNNVFARDVGKLWLRKKIGDETIREIFVMYCSGTPLQRLYQEFCELGFWPYQIVQALSVYHRERAAILNGIPSHEVLLGSEICARLRISDRHVLEELVRTELQRVSFLKSSRRLCLVSAESLTEYLGPYACKRLYRSKHVQAILKSYGCDITINRIDKLAKRYGIGFKLLPHKKNSAYLFSLEDVMTLYRIHRGNEK